MMSVATLILAAFFWGTSQAYPLVLSSDLGYNNYQQSCLGIACYPVSTYGNGLAAPLQIVDNISPRTVDVSRENFVRSYGLGQTEIGTRNEVAVRPSVVAVPYSRFYSSISPVGSSIRGINRNLFLTGDDVGLRNRYSVLTSDYDVGIRSALPVASSLSGYGDAIILAK